MHSHLELHHHLGFVSLSLRTTTIVRCKSSANLCHKYPSRKKWILTKLPAYPHSYQALATTRPWRISASWLHSDYQNGGNNKWRGLQSPFFDILKTVSSPEFQFENFLYNMLAVTGLQPMIGASDTRCGYTRAVTHVPPPVAVTRWHPVQLHTYPQGCSYTITEVVVQYCSTKHSIESSCRH